MFSIFSISSQKAYELGMYGADYAWILQESLEQHRWWENEENLECSLKNLHSAVENVLLVSSFNNIVGGEKSISGLVNPKAVFFTDFTLSSLLLLTTLLLFPFHSVQHRRMRISRKS